MPGFELFDDKEKKEVLDVLESGILMRYNFDTLRNGHWKAKELEKEISTRLNVEYTQLCSSGTSSLTIALACCGIGAEDEVIVPPFTFVASFEAILQAGATPIFADIDETLCLAPDAIEKAITPKTKAVMLVHMCGSMGQIDEIKKICEKHQLKLIEDACQAFGGTFKGQSLGSFGDMGCFSFDFVKTITCGEGGAIITNDKNLYTKADAFSDHGHDHIGNDRGGENHPFIGYNYRISELHAAVGLAQIKKINTIIEIQKRNKKILKDKLTSIEAITFRKIPDEEGDNASFLSFFLPNEALARKAVKKLTEGGIDGAFYWYTNNWHYIKKWEHLTQMKTLAKYPAERQNKINDSQKKLKQSDTIISRNISCLIKLSWTEEEVKERAEKMYDILKVIVNC